MNRLDLGATLSPKCGRAAGPLTEVEGGHCLRLIATALIAALLLIFNPKPANADMNLKLYAYNKMDWSEFQCYNWLIIKESSWNPKARNGSHYGLGQMRSTWYKDLYEVWRTTINNFFDVIQSKSETVKQAIFVNGAKIDFWSMEDPDSGRGRKYHRVIIDS